MPHLPPASWLESRGRRHGAVIPPVGTGAFFPAVQGSEKKKKGKEKRRKEKKARKKEVKQKREIEGKKENK